MVNKPFFRSYLLGGLAWLIPLDPFQAGYWVSCVGECSRTAEGQKELIQKGENGDAAKGRMKSWVQMSLEI